MDMKIKITNLSTDAYFSMMRLGINIQAEGLDEDFAYFRKYQEANREAFADAVEQWVADCKSKALQTVLTSWGTAGGECEEPKVSETSMEEANKITEAATEKRRGRPKKEKVSEVPASSQEPKVEETGTVTNIPVGAGCGAPAPVSEAPVAAPVAEKKEEVPSEKPTGAPVIYVKSNKDHALWLQKKLDAIEPTWKSTATSIEFARNKLVPALDGKAVVFFGEAENPTFLSKLAVAFAMKDISYLKGVFMET